MRIVLLGGGGQASDVLGAIEALRQTSGDDGGIEVAGVLDDGEIDPRRFDGRDVRQIGALGDLGTIDATHFIACVGYPRGRRAVADLAERDGRQAATIIHPRAWVHERAVIGAGTVILAGVCVSPGCVLGRHVHLGQGSLLGHECQVGAYASVMPGAAVSGDVRLGEGAMIGANATILEGLSFGDWAQLGAGAVATRDIPPGATAIGQPARWRGSTGAG